MRCKQTCIPQVYGTAIKDGKVCIVMKLYRESLQGLLKRQGGKLPLSEVFTHYSQVDMLCRIRSEKARDRWIGEPRQT